MSLTVGELNAILSVDDQAMDPGLRRAEQALRQSGQRMGSDADQAGQQAGQNLGEGIVRGTDGRLRNARGRFVAAGRQAGDAVGDGLADGAADGADAAVAEAEGGLSQLQTVSLAAGAAAGAVLVSAFGQALEQSQITAKLGAALGKTPAEAQRYGKIAGELYADAITQDFQGAADTISAVMGSGLVPADATNAQIESISTRVSDLSTTFDQDLSKTVNAASQLIRTGLAKDSTEALDLLAKGFTTSANKSDDFLDTVNEYGTQFRKAGVDGTQALGLIDQAIKAGARDSDIAADAIKEFGIRAIDGSKGTADGFKSLGLNADDMATKFSKGGKTANGVLDLTLDRLRGVKDPVKQSQIAVALFGTQAEDLGSALLAMDPSSAASGIGEVGGSADRLGSTLRDNAGVAVEAFKRQMMQGLVEVIGSQVLPKLMSLVSFLSDHQGELKLFASVLTAVVVPALVLLGGKAAWAGIQMARAWVMGLGPVAWVGLAIGALVVLVIAYWDEIKGATEAVWSWLVEKITWAKDMAVNAFLNFTLIGLLIKHWSSIKETAASWWNGLVEWVKKIPGRLYNAFLNWTLLGLIIKHWSSIKTGTVNKATEMVNWVKGLPGRISKAVGSLNRLLYNKGVAVAQGLWSGIQSMSGWLASKLTSWAKSAIPGPIAKALGIASPSKVTKAQGRWIARGLIDGLTGSSKQIKAAATKVSDILRDNLDPGKKQSKALGKVAAGSKKLQQLASQEERTAARLKTATKKLSDQIAARDKLSASVKEGVLSSANITSQDTGGWPQTAETILAGLKQDTAASQQFAKNLAVLREKGVRADLISQIAEAGVEGGASTAAALAAADSTQIKAINQQQGALVKAAGSAGTTAGDAMYGAGIDAAEGLVKGLKDRQSSINKQMESIAKSMSAAIRKELGIKSPSKVMARVGVFTARGLIKGMDGERKAVTRSMTSLVETPAAGSWSSGSGTSGGKGGGQKTVLEFRSSGRGEDDYLIDRVRRGIRKKGGGDAGLVLTGRRG